MAAPWEAGRAGDGAALQGGLDAGNAIGRAQLAAAVGLAQSALAAERPARLGLLCDNGMDWVVADLAAQAVGIPLVPLPAFFTQSQLAHALDAAGVDALLCSRDEMAAKLGFSAAGTLVGTGLQLARRTPGGLPPLPAGTSKITFTSGTTGMPKGVCLGSGQQWAVAGAIGVATRSLGLARHLCLLPLPVLLENVAGVYAALLEGATCILPPLAEVGVAGSSGFDAARCLSAIDAARAQSVILLPQMLRALLAAVAAGSPLPASLRFAAVGGGRVAPALLAQSHALGLPAFEGYGLSECASVVALNLPSAARAGSAGRPLDHVRVRANGAREIEVAGNACLGYLGGDAIPADDWIATGDLGYLDEAGFLHIDGRSKNLIITSFGRNVSPEWPESELLAGPTIAQAAIFGEARPTLCAVLVPPSPGLTDAALQAQVDAANQRLPDYARIGPWVRAEVPFLAANGLATSNGRIRREAVRDAYSQRLNDAYRRWSGAISDAVL